MVIDKLPPFDTDAEESLLGSILIDDNCLDKIFIEPGDFFREVNGWIFEAILSIRKESGFVDQVTLAHELLRRGKLEECGGAAFLNHLIAVVPTSLHAEYYANIVRELACKRAIISLASNLQHLSMNDTHSSELINKAERGILDISMRLPDKGYDSAYELSDYAVDRYAKLSEAPTLIPTYIPRLPDRMGFGPHEFSVDEMIGGLGCGNLVTIGARPGVGKTTFINEMALRQSHPNNKLPVLIFSLEMPKADMVDRTITMLSGINPLRIHLRKMDDNDNFSLTKAIGEFSEYKYYLYRKPHATIGDIRQRSYQAVNKEGIRVIYIDYLQLIQVPESKSAYERVSSVTRELKLLAMKLDVPIVVASQMNRETEYSKDKRPQLNELRESGTIEQDSDMVLLLYRDDKYDKEANPGVVEVIVAKNRLTGLEGTVKIFYDFTQRRFIED
jgi:replicative DNA helicase